VPDLAWWEVLLRLGAAAGLGGAIGVERELHEQEAGFRTHLLVAIGAALFTIVSAYAWRDFQFGAGTGVSFDPTRIAAQVVTGIGFIGAGAIIRQGLSIRGLTTAATLWVVAAIGMAAGAGYYSAGLITTVIVLFALWPLRVVARVVLDQPRERRLWVDLQAHAGSGPVLAELEQLGIGVESYSREQGEEGRRLHLVLDLPSSTRHDEVTRSLAELPDVRSVRWGS
jgi:putative Mg2+ transporter-C (MgtC) family protein